MFDQTMISTVTAATTVATAEGLTDVGRVVLARPTRLLPDRFSADPPDPLRRANPQPSTADQ
jgi:hypothetical protein